MRKMLAAVFIVLGLHIYPAHADEWSLPQHVGVSNTPFSNCTYNVSILTIVCPQIGNDIINGNGHVLNIASGVKIIVSGSWNLSPRLKINPQKNKNVTIEFRGGMNANGQGIEVNANLIFSSATNLGNLTVYGDVYVSQGNLTINGNGEVVGDVRVKGDVNTNGYVSGNISAEGSVTTNGGSYTGSINSKTSVMNNGEVEEYINSPKITQQGIVAGKKNITEITDPNILCNINQNEGPCSGRGATVHHYRLSFASPLLSCQAIPVTVTACADAACSATVAQSNSITLTPSGRWIGGATKAFADSGSLVAYMTRVSGSVTLGLNGESYSCTPGNCIIDIRDSGFRIEVPDIIANKPDTATIQAVRKGESSERCVADGGFAGKTKAVKFWSRYLDPDDASQVGDRPILLSGSAIAQSKAAATAINTSFDHNAQAKLPLNYTDAGWMQLNASYTGSGEDAGLLMSGSGSFVSRPYGLYLTTDSTCLVAGVSGDCPLFTKAGDAFPLRIEARAWERDGEPLTAYELKDNIATPNFRMAGIGLEAEPVAPSGGEAGVVTPASYGHALGEQSTAQVALSEVGVFRLRATPAASAYFGMTVGGGQSDLIGRIIPAWLEVDASDLSQQPGCPAPSAFTYQDQPTRLSGGLKVLGFGRGNNQTLNYRGDFWRVGTDQVYGLYRSDSAPARGEDAHVTPEPAIELDPENARLQFKDDYSYPRKATPSPLDESFELKWVIWDLHDTDNVYFSNREGAQITWGTETEVVPVSGLIKDSQLRLGQLRSENVRVPLGNSGQAPIMLEHWGGAAWEAATDNGCTTLATPVDTPEQLNFPDPGVTAATLDAAIWNQSLLQVTATAPEAPQGSVLLRHLLRSNGANATWLCRKRSEVSAPLGGVCTYKEGGDAETRSSITFGIYQGSERLIFRREIYR